MNAVREVNRQLSMFRVIVVTMVTPLERSRRAIKKLLGDSVIFVYCYCTVDVCASRDQRGLYEHGAENIEYFETPRIEHFMVDMRSCDERSAVLNVAEHLFLEGF